MFESRRNQNPHNFSLEALGGATIALGAGLLAVSVAERQIPLLASGATLLVVGTTGIVVGIYERARSQPFTPENSQALITNELYALLRSEARNFLDTLGVPSNPGYTDTEITNNLWRVYKGHPVDSDKVKLQAPEQESAEAFAAELGEIFELEPPITAGKLLLKLAEVQSI